MGFTLLHPADQEPASCEGPLPGSSIPPSPPTRKGKGKGKGEGKPFRVQSTVYQRLEEIGEGSFGVVFKAKDLNTGDLVAIKQIHLDDRMSSLLAHKGLSQQSEVDHHSSCSGHRAIVRMRGVFMRHRAVFMVMDYIPQDLRLLLRNQPELFNEQGVRKMMTQLLRGIAYIHQKMIIHRDIKPANILVNLKGGRVAKICDFGISRSFRPGFLLPPLPKPAGTRPYCAPEMLAGKEYSEVIDVWSAGCVMAEMLTGDILFRAKDLAEHLDLIHKIMAVESLHEEEGGRLRDRIPPTMLSQHGFDLLTSLLAVDPRERITAKEALSHPWFRQIME